MECHCGSKSERNSDVNIRFGIVQNILVQWGQNPTRAMEGRIKIEEYMVHNKCLLSALYILMNSIPILQMRNPGTERMNNLTKAAWTEGGRGGSSLCREPHLTSLQHRQTDDQKVDSLRRQQRVGVRVGEAVRLIGFFF